MTGRRVWIVVAEQEDGDLTATLHATEAAAERWAEGLEGVERVEVTSDWLEG